MAWVLGYLYLEKVLFSLSANMYSRSLWWSTRKYLASQWRILCNKCNWGYKGLHNKELEAIWRLDLWFQVKNFDWMYFLGRPHPIRTTYQVDRIFCLYWMRSSMKGKSFKSLKIYLADFVDNLNFKHFLFYSDMETSADNITSFDKFNLIFSNKKFRVERNKVK